MVCGAAAVGVVLVVPKVEKPCDTRSFAEAGAVLGTVEGDAAAEPPAMQELGSAPTVPQLTGPLFDGTQFTVPSALAVGV